MDNRPTWWRLTERDLLAYYEAGLAIEKLEMEISRLAECIEQGRRITPGFYGEAVCDDEYTGRAYAGPDRSGLVAQISSSEQQEESLVCRKLDYEAKLSKKRWYRDLIQRTIAYKFQRNPEYIEFIDFYWWSGLSLVKHRKRLVLHKMRYLDDRTFDRWRRDIVEQLAVAWGYKESEAEEVRGVKP